MLSEKTTRKILEAASYADIGKELMHDDLVDIASVSELDLEAIESLVTQYSKERYEEEPTTMIVG